MSLRLNPRHRTLTVICLGITGGIIALYLLQWFFAHADQQWRDWLVTKSAANSAARPSPQHPRIVFLALDDDTRSLDAIFSDDLEKSAALRLMKNGFPWNRAVYAHIMDRLIGAGAKVVIFDLVFPSEREGDDVFRAALERHARHVVIGTNLVTKEQEDGGGSTLSRMPSHELPTPQLRPPAGAPSWLGYVNVHPDSDGLVRRLRYRTTILEFFGIPSDENREELYSLVARGLEKSGLQHRIPATRQPFMFRFAEDFQPRSLHEIFVEPQWNAPPYNGGELFRDRIVFIGATGESSEDRLQTPGGVKFGPQIHLSAMNAALNGDFIVETPMSLDVLLITLGGGIAWLIGGWVRRPILRLTLIVLAGLAYYQVAQNLANNTGVLMLLFSPLLALTACGITWAAWEQVLDRVERQRTRRALERYVGHDVAREVLDNPATYLNSLGGVRKEITVLFSDVRGFTTLTESADPQALVAQLNEYFAEMVAIVFANQGTVDKFIGDAVMAHWGSIVSDGPHSDAAHAVTTALQMRKVLVRLNQGWKQRGIVELSFGIGINQGDAIVGNIGAAGAHEKMDFTVIGDAVNLGSRLEGVTKSYHIDLCIGENVANLVRDSFILRSVDLIVVKGKTKPVEVFTVVNKRNPSTAEPPWLSVHEEAVRFFRAGDFAAAERAWREVLAAIPNDGLSQVFIERCVELQKEPPQTPWTGVYEMKSK